PQFLMLRLWGAKAQEIAFLVLKHAFVLSLCGFLLGFVLSFAVWQIVLLWQTDFPSFTSVLSQQIQHLTLFALLIFVFTLLACIWPVVRIYKLSLHSQSV